jgi:poly-gamma-glutamate capsule biosynthesis protein CapA/YwtB (metallophosphatase superfamily)
VARRADGQPNSTSGDPGGGSLPPWSSLGLGPAPRPGFERAWEPPADELEPTADLPERPPSRLGRGARILLPVLIGLLLVGTAVGLVWFDVIGGGSDTPTPTASALAGGPGSSGTPGGTPRPSPRAGTPAAAQARTPAGPHTAAGATVAATTVPTPSTAVTAAPLLLASGTGEVAGLQAADLAARLREAIGTHLPGQRIDVVSNDRLDEAAIAVGPTTPPNGFAARVIAIAPLAVVTAPRLPLVAVDRDQADRLVRGEIADWRDVGSPVQLAVEPVALKGYAPRDAKPVATYRDYDALVAGLARHPGGVALVPVNLVDFRVSVLAIDGIDPLRGEGDVMAYPFGARLYVGIRADQTTALGPALDAALADLGLPQPVAPVARVAFAGDVVPGRNAHQRFGAGDPVHSFAAIAPLLAGYDLTVANLEGALPSSPATPAAGTPAAFTGDPALTQGLALAGIDAVSLANDHALAAGATGLTDTLATLRAAGIVAFGAGANLQEARQPVVVEVNGVKIALLGIDGVTGNPDRAEPGVVGDAAAATDNAPGTNPLVLDQVRADIRAATKEADIVIPYFHMGVEGKETTPDWVVAVAHAAVDAGAAAVIVTHPRVAGGIEIYKGRPIAYSLGSLVADQMQSAQTRQGLILELTLRGKTIVGLRLRGVEIEDFNQPRPMTDGEEAALLDRVWSLSDRLTNR